MREASSLGPSGKGDSPWRGKQDDAVPLTQHQWQQESARQEDPAVSGRGVWQRLRVVLLLALFAGLVGWFAYSVSFAPVQTPVIVVEAARYEWPLPPNAWAEEDLDALAALHSQNIFLTHLAVERQSSAEVLAALDAQLARAASGRTPPESLVLYISMLGTVDGAAVPCLVPPGASPLESDQWLTVPKLLDRIKQHRALHHCQKLLVLDCNRVETDWRLCTLYNGFADRLAEAVSAAQVPRLAVINSAGPDQLGWSSPELEASIFGYYLRLGLAGLADTKTGNGDGHVSLRELHRYLVDQVDGWAVFNRAAHQQPMLLPDDADDFSLVWSLNQRTQKRLASPPMPGRHAAVSDEERGRLWRKREEFAVLNPGRTDPLAWRDFQQRLVWLDQACAAGKAYSASARNTYAELASQAAMISERAAADDRSGPARPVNLFRERADLHLAAHSLPFARYLRQTTGGLESRLAGLNRAATPDTVAQMVSHLDQLDNGQLLVERQFLRLLSRYDMAKLLKPPALLGRALEVRELAERAALPADERALAAIAPAVSEADEARRKAEDLWLSAQAGDRSQALAGWTAAQSGYKRSGSLNAELARGWALSDRAWAELPYLAEWLCRGLPLGQTSAANDKRISEMLFPLIEQAQSLSAALDSYAADDADGQSPSVTREMADVTDGLNRFAAFVAAQCQLLLKPDEPAAASLLEIRAMLGLPLVPAQVRDQLQKRFAELNARLQSDFVAGKTTVEPAEASGQPPVQRISYSQRAATRWPTHPAMAILFADISPEELAESNASGSIGAAADPVGKLAGLSAAMRKRLLKLPADIRRGLEAEADTDEQAGAHAGLQQASSRVRTASGFWFPALAHDPVELLGQRNLQRLFVWQAVRALDDFLGPAAENEATFFARVADAYIESVKRVGDVSGSIQRDVSSLERVKSQRVEAAREGVGIRAADLLLTDVTTNANEAVDLVAGREELAQAIPPGFATIFLHDATGRFEGGAKTKAMPPGPGSSVVKYPLAAAALAGRGPMLQASWLYRGNEVSASFLLRPPRGMKVDFEPYSYGPPRVTVHGRNRKRASIEFILDCSNSMKQLTRSEGPNDAEKVPRLNVARNALQQMLGQLAESDARVGVRFFGHRVGWNIKHPEQLLRQPDYPGDIPDALLPSMDVEQVLPLGRFDETVAESVADKLKKIKPWGESPLYLALVESLGDFAGEPEDSEKSIIVIADGINYQFNSPEPKSRDDVVAAFKGKKVAINIVGFDIPPEEAAEARRDFSLLADETGGSYVSAANATSLIKSLERLLGPQDYRLLDGQDRVVGEARLGMPVVITPPPDRMQSYTVSLDRLSTPLELQGGESVELFQSRDGSRLETARYDTGEPRYLPVLRGANETSGYLLGVHRPVRVEDSARFPLSIVRADHGFAARPAEVWMEIRPPQGSPEKAGQIAVFYDANYLPGTSVPVLNCVAGNWPASAKTAVISAWFKYQQTPPARTLSFDSLLGRPSEAEPIPPLDGLPNVSIQVRLDRDPQSPDDFRLAVVERHDSQSPSLASLKVETFPVAQRVVHRFDSTNRLVTHQFFFRRVAKGEINSHELRLTRAADAKADADMAEPTEVDVSVASDLIRLAPPKNRQ
jgi:hypothetical protein